MTKTTKKFATFLSNPVWQGIGVVIAIIAVIVAIIISLYQSKIDQQASEILVLKNQLDESNKKITALTTQLGERDAEILSLNKRLAIIVSNGLLEGILSTGSAQFEWQWAGENLYGRFTLSDLNGKKIVSRAKMGLIQKTLQDTIVMNGLVFDLAPDTTGSFVINNDGSITLDLTVEKKSRRTESINLETINGTLQQTLCYAGRVSYSGSEGSFMGDMILVNYISSLGIQVDDWFTSKQDWFEKYLLDR
ncbi:MAG: hypothetical protein HY865_19220 [Chloroflexi bacterium]|nr:hypothetical protein [Chloroflexota bacterium]